jgi:Tfp pilus assembly protein PilP
MTVPAGPAVTPEAKGTPAAAAPPAAAPVAKEAAPPPFAYVTVGKADPFKPFVELTPPPPPKTGEAPKRKATTGRPISPLQQAEASQFHLVGIIGDQARRIAMVEDRAGKRHYTLSVGAAIGTNDGRVVSILPDRVIIEEKVPLEGRKTRVNRVTLMLHKENEGKP